MPKFVIRTSTGNYVKGGRSSTDSHLSFVESLQEARVYDRRGDATKSINEHFRSHQGLEVVPIVLSQPILTYTRL